MTQTDIFHQDRPKSVSDSPEPYDGRAPRVRGCDTSGAAADRSERSRRCVRQQVLERLRQAGPAGMTCDEVEVAMELRHQTASARIRELVLQGLVEASGERRKTRTGSTAKVWVVK